jgi:hypothetical protein
MTHVGWVACILQQGWLITTIHSCGSIQRALAAAVLGLGCWLTMCSRNPWHQLPSPPAATAAVRAALSNSSSSGGRARACQSSCQSCCSCWAGLTAPSYTSRHRPSSKQLRPPHAPGQRVFTRGMRIACLGRSRLAAAVPALLQEYQTWLLRPNLGLHKAVSRDCNSGSGENGYRTACCHALLVSRSALEHWSAAVLC